MDKRLLEIMQHALGLDQYGRGASYRNYFSAGADDEPACRELVAMGYAVEHKRNTIYHGYNISITDAGKSAVREFSPNPPKLTRGQQRWRQFLQLDSGLSFKEWLKHHGREA
jgi:hypothetical protein